MAAVTDTDRGRAIGHARRLGLVLAAVAVWPGAMANPNPPTAAADTARPAGLQQAGKGRPAPPSLVASGAATHTWHDGSRRRTLRMDPMQLADFGAGTDGRPMLQTTNGTGRASSALQSPVFVDDTGQLRALPGGVMVVLKSPLNAAAAQILFNQLGVRPSRPLTDALWLVESPAGLPSLELANRLHDSGLFASAQPNWWIDRARK